MTEELNQALVRKSSKILKLVNELKLYQKIYDSPSTALSRRNHLAEIIKQIHFEISSAAEGEIESEVS